LAAPFEPDFYRPTGKSVIIATRTREARALTFDDKIDILERIAVEAFPTYQVFKTVSAILALVRVDALVPCPPVNCY